MVFIDASYFKDVVFTRDGSYLDIISKIVDTKQAPAVSVLAVPAILKSGRRIGVTDQTIFQLLSMCRVEPSHDSDFEWAKQYEADDDFFGALQVATALRCDCNIYAASNIERRERYRQFIAML